MTCSWPDGFQRRNGTTRALGGILTDVGKSVPPKVSKPVWRKLGVANGVLNVLMPEIVLQGARVVAIVGKFEPACMAEHVRMHTERHLGSLPQPSDHSAEAHRAHGRSALTHEDVAAWSLLALKPAQGAKLVAGQWMNRGNAVLEAGSMRARQAENALRRA